jgi:hypothetical protein
VTSNYYDITKVDIDSRDPNIRGRVGSILHSGTEQDRDDFHRMMDQGLTLDDALNRVANNIALRASRITARTSDRRV